MMRTACVTAALLLLCLSTGCITRRYTITSSPLGAMVYLNDKPLGMTPVDNHFVYYGKYKFTLIKEGYEPLEVEQEIDTPWYEIGGIDFITENINPFKVRDIRLFHYNLKPLQAVPPDKVLDRSTQLRLRGKGIGAPAGVPVPLEPHDTSPTLPPPTPVPAAPAIPTLPAPRPLPAPGTLPAAPPPPGPPPTFGALPGSPAPRP